MSVLKSVMLVLVFACLTSAVTAQDAATKTPAKKPVVAKMRSEYQPPKVDDSLPHVLLIGDSISIGYMLDARKELAGVANVWRPATNCGPTTRGLTSLDAWLGDRKWDVIHFNFGLHDLKYVGPKGGNLADPKAADSAPQVSIEDYATNLRQIARQLKATGATVIWRETTPVPEGAKGRIPGDSKRYNDVAAKVIAEVGGIETDPMYDVALQHKNLQRKADVHYTAEGSALLGKQVAKTVRAALESRAK
ncbi:hypothetical protein K227x_62460 [Rubripirellula lacrimiformis]|uniref:SGNH hydrolase-type esterase domain-containing protein n=1 Tax=Rubripirellula lacrimiformis TaxID=1930273 RepID=A0A517NL01_9BACT|nr:SGNH/GDSL hydrolase family protein [Rubripirellula lacrimiformis]QDT07817.1 hypothetical protein K227x_62460 [Rubripirellula lacrimiformis]